MRAVVKAKFDQNAEIRQWLIDTSDAILVEGGALVGDYGVCTRIGKNHLGKILMELRDVYQKGGE